MDSPFITLDRNTNEKDLAILMEEKGIGPIIVVDKGLLIGLVTKRDLVQIVATGVDPCEIKISEIQSSPLITMEKDAGILKAMKKMRRHKIT